ncbi:hypothetical protein [Clostridiisalibacter paucivorans]|uniref:hypothetical protein n=1 Tax=Clostridiisalibacter paucivorans TaxID=408753 RepID=UPI0012ECB4BE|nr:hypothetical protein [Clostridiisalibacter paucivorans]
MAIVAITAITIVAFVTLVSIMVYFTEKKIKAGFKSKAESINTKTESDVTIEAIDDKK